MKGTLPLYYNLLRFPQKDQIVLLVLFYLYTVYWILSTKQGDVGGGGPGRIGLIGRQSTLPLYSVSRFRWREFKECCLERGKLKLNKFTRLARDEPGNEFAGYPPRWHPTDRYSVTRYPAYVLYQIIHVNHNYEKL